MRTRLILLLAISLSLPVQAEETRDGFASRMVQESTYTSKRLSQAQRIAAIAAATAELNGEINRMHDKVIRERQSAESRCLSLMPLEKDLRQLKSELEEEWVKASQSGLDTDFRLNENFSKISVTLSRLTKFREESAREYGSELFSAALSTSRSLPIIPAVAGIPFCDTSRTTLALTRLRSHFHLAIMQNDLIEAVNVLHRAQALIEQTRKVLQNCGVKDQPTFEKLALSQEKLRLRQWAEALEITNDCLVDSYMKPNCAQLMSKRSTAVAIAKNFHRRAAGLKKVPPRGVGK